ncbi:hypothetical protein KKE92_04910 [Candidatus Micrarchaeota archaeon]|nr:hypothetical protein [Candidatus Micrarchaeota archaeon]
MPPPPPRVKDDMTGRQFIASVRNLSQPQIEERIFQQAIRGNMPSFMRPENFYEIAVSGVIDGAQVEMRVRVAPDYFAIGSDGDYVRVPMSPLLARRLADHFGWVLPTSRIVDIVDEQAGLGSTGHMDFNAAPDIAKRVIDPETQKRVSARWNHREYGAYEGKWMMSPQFTEEQNKMIQEQIEAEHERMRRDNPENPNIPGVSDVLRAGHKKDIIYHRETVARRTVCIYHPRVQSVNYVSHEETYADYSHAFRAVDDSVEVRYIERDGSRHSETLPMATILNDEHLYRLLSDHKIDIRRQYQPRIRNPKRSMIDPTVIAPQEERRLPPPRRRA